MIKLVFDGLRKGLKMLEFNEERLHYYDADIDDDQFEKFNLHILTIIDPPYRMIEEAIYRNPYMYNIYGVASIELQKHIVKQNKNLIKIINNPCEEVQQAAVTSNGLAIEHIENPSYKVQSLAVENNGMALRYISNPCDEICMKAIDRNPRAIQFVLKNLSDTVIENILSKKGSAIEYIDDPTLSMQLAAVRNNGHSIRFIKDPSFEVQVEAVKNKIFAIENIKNISEPAIDVFLDLIFNNVNFINGEKKYMALFKHIENKKLSGAEDRMHSIEFYRQFIANKNNEYKSLRMKKIMEKNRLDHLEKKCRFCNKTNIIHEDTQLCECGSVL